MYKLGLHIGHNASCALMRDGKIVYVGQEERFCRTKNIMGFPFQALKHGFERERISGTDIDAACYTSIIESALFNKASYITNFSIRDYHDYYGDRYYNRIMAGENCLDYLKWVRDEDKFNAHPSYFDFSFLDDEDVLLDDEKSNQLFQKEQLRFLSETFGIPTERIQFTDHHTGHAYYAYYASPFRGKECGVIVLDGWGDGANQTVWQAKNDEITELARAAENDIGRVYKLATLLLGMRPDEHEYKVMGMAPYAKDDYISKTYEALAPLSKIENMKIVKDQRPDNLFTYLKDAWLDKRFDNIGGAVQRFSEEIGCALVQNIHEKTGLRRFVVSGGIAMNVKMNQAISELDCVDDFFVCSSGADESLSIGGCYLLNKGGQPLPNAYLGFDAADDLETQDWDEIMQEFDLQEDITDEEIAEILANGEIVARIAGRAEFGARALGNRSILADPSRADSVYRINEAIKQRDFWMPFALSILEDHADDYLDNPKRLAAPFMTIAFNTLPNNYDKIKAGTHPYDRTVRPQFVSPELTPHYYALISAFKNRTGIPALLNTSFNLHGEPIVNDLQDALHTLRSSGLNYVLFENYLISKKKF